jgi:hypothetical protein
MTSRRARLALSLPLALVAAGAFAADDAWQRFGRDVDPNTFIVGHPASPRWRIAHANHEHPAVVAAREAGEAGVDANTFIVQPPASVSWKERGDDSVRTAANGR